MPGYTLHSIPKAIVCAQTQIISSDTPYLNHSPVSSFSYTSSKVYICWNKLPKIRVPLYCHVLKICQGGSIPSGSVSNSSAGTQGTAPLPSWAASPGGFPVTPDAVLPAAWPQFLHAALSFFVVIHTAFFAVKMSFYFISTWQSPAYSNGYVP